MIITSVVFLLGCRITWYAWIRRVRPRVFRLPAYHPAAVTIAAGFASILALAWSAYPLRGRGKAGLPSCSAPSAWLVGLAVVMLGSRW